MPSIAIWPIEAQHCRHGGSETFRGAGRRNDRAQVLKERAALCPGISVQPSRYDYPDSAITVAENDSKYAITLTLDGKPPGTSRVRGQVLIFQEHQPLPSEQML